MHSATPELPINNQSLSPSSNVSFIVTGFGPFHGVPNNPTTTLCHRIQYHFASISTGPQHSTVEKEEECSGEIDEVAVKDVDVAVLDTAAHTVRNEITAIYDKIKTKIGKTVHPSEAETITTASKDNNIDNGHKQLQQIFVILHLGFHSGTCFHLEERAYNNATFRVPDELGYQPINECIIDKDPLGISYQTNLNLIELQAELNTSSISPPFFSNALNTSTFPRQQQQPLVKISDKKVHNHEEGLLVEMRINCNAIISQDPGLFVCNYTYCCSLAESIAINSSSSINNKRSGVVVDDLQDVNPDQQPRRKDDDSEVYVLFVHVPSFEIIPENDQVSFLLKLMNCIEKQITERQKSCHHYRVQTL